MKKKNIYLLFVSLLAITFPLSIISYGSGPATAVNQGYTSAPGEGGLACANCHTAGGPFGATSVAIQVLNLNNSPVTQYQAGATYNVTARVNHLVGAPAKFGVQMTTLNQFNNFAGAYSNPSSNAKIATASMVAGGRPYLEHRNFTSNTFTTQWTAPNNQTSGNITFYASGIAANGDNGNTGDTGSGGFAVTLTFNPTFAIELLSFEAEQAGEGVQLDWITASEKDNDYFSIEHSPDGLTFSEIGKLDGAGTTEQETAYRFTHDKPAEGANYYRIVDTDLNGQSHYSNITQVIVYPALSASLYPNPVKDITRLDVKGLDQASATLRITNNLGAIVREQVVQRAQTLDLSGLDAGIYFYSLHHNTFQDLITAGKLIKID